MDDPDLRAEGSRKKSRTARARLDLSDSDDDDDNIVPGTPPLSPIFREKRKRTIRTFQPNPTNEDPDNTLPPPEHDPLNQRLDSDNLPDLVQNCRQIDNLKYSDEENEQEEIPDNRNGLRKSASFSMALENDILPTSSNLPDGISPNDGPSTSNGLRNDTNENAKKKGKGKKRRSNPLACFQGNSPSERPNSKRRKREEKKETPMMYILSSSDSDDPEPVREVPTIDSSDLDSSEWEDRVLSGAAVRPRKSAPKLPKNQTANMGFIDANDKTKDSSIGVSLITKRSPIFGRVRPPSRRSVGPTPGTSSAPGMPGRGEEDDSLVILDWVNTSPRAERSPGGTMRTPRMSRRRERTLSGTPVFVRRERQEQEDMRMARQLQEQADMEYAMQLANEQPNSPRAPRPGNHSGNPYANHVIPGLPVGQGLPVADRRAPVHISPRRMRNNGTRRPRRNEPDLNMLQRMMQSPDSSDEDPLAGSLFRRFYPPPGTVGAAPPRRGRRPRGGGHAAGPAHFMHEGLMMGGPAGAHGGDYEYLLALGELLGDAKSKGLSKSNIEQLPTLKYEKKGGQAQESEECSVCMTGYEVGEDLRILPCFHNFHKTCIDKWITGNATCPICRVAVRLDGQAT